MLDRIRGRGVLIAGSLLWLGLATGMATTFAAAVVWRDGAYDRFGVDLGRVYFVVDWWGPGFELVLGSAAGRDPTGWRLDGPLPFCPDVLLPHRLVYWGGTFISMPLWIPLVAALFPLAYGWLKRRPRNAHQCGCGYDLTGNVSGRCPECGQPTAR